MMSGNESDIRVLHVIPAFYPAFSYGGPIQTVYRLCQGLLEAGCDVKVLTTDANGSDRLPVMTNRECRIDHGIRVRYCRRLWRNSVSARLLMVLREYSVWADVIHLTGVYSFPTIPTLAMARMLQRPVVWSPRGGFQAWAGERRQTAKRAWRVVCRTVMPAACVLHVTSEAEGEACKLRLPGVPILVVPNGVDVPKEVELRREAENVRFLYLGRLHPIKGLDALISACEILNRNGGIGSWSLTVAGPSADGYGPKLQDEVVSRGLSHRVRFLGEVAVEEKTKLFREADVLILPSRAESFGMVVAEALAYAIPVIASKGTPWSGLERVGCGLWSDDSPQALAMSMQRISKMPLREMGEKGRRWMQEEFDWGVTSALMVNCYRRVIGR